MKFTSVVGYHMNPLTCGVAKFNAELAKRLGVPFIPVYGSEWGDKPLLSLKWGELHSGNQNGLRALTVPIAIHRHSVFWHDAGDPIITDRAEHVFYADPSLGSPGLWCPSLLTPSKPRTVRLFSFGMAGRLQSQYYAKVRELLEAAGLDYHLRVSVGLHEGTSLSDASHHFDALYEVMGRDKVTILGVLSDDAVVEELGRADEVLAFFQNGLRDNNTTVHAALAYGKRVITNHDHSTGDELARRTIDIHRWSVWPTTDVWTWDQLLHEMERICAQSRSTAAR